MIFNDISLLLGTELTSQEITIVYNITPLNVFIHNDSLATHTLESNKTITTILTPLYYKTIPSIVSSIGYSRGNLYTFVLNNQFTKHRSTNYKGCI